ncbi:unnamed protein product, partial [Meganyctiphanes norvegica]
AGVLVSVQVTHWTTQDQQMEFYSELCLSLLMLVFTVTCEEMLRDVVTGEQPEDIAEEPNGFNTAKEAETTKVPSPFEDFNNLENDSISASESLSLQIVTNETEHIYIHNIGNTSLKKSEYITYNPAFSDNKSENVTDNKKEKVNVSKIISKPENSTQGILQNYDISINKQTMNKQKNIRLKKPAEIFEELLKENAYDEVCGHKSITWLLTEANNSNVPFLLGDCWEYMCKNTYPSVMTGKFDGNTIVWFFAESFECYEALPDNDRNSSLFYKIVDVAEDVKLFFLNPRCPQMMGTVNVFLSLHYTPWGLPISCQEDICLVGSDELHFESIDINLVTQMKSNDNTLRNKCFNDLYKKLGDTNDLYRMNSSVKCRDIKQKNINNYDQNVKYCYSENYPESSPCKTMYVVRNNSYHYQVIIPVRAGECSSLNENEWFELLHSYLSSLHNSSIHKNLHLCLLRKGQRMEYNNNKYVHLLDDMLGHEILFPNISESCVTFFCDSAVQISSSNRRV